MQEKRKNGQTFVPKSRGWASVARQLERTFKEGILRMKGTHSKRLRSRQKTRRFPCAEAVSPVSGEDFTSSPSQGKEKRTKSHFVKRNTHSR